MKYLLALCFLFTVTFCFAQKSKFQQVFYFDNSGYKVPTIDSADYIRVVSQPDSGSTLFSVVDYYRNSKPKLMGKSSTIDPATFEDQCVTYYSNGKRESVFTYTGGRLIGPGYLFYPNGKLHASITYDTVSTVPAEQNIKITSCLDSSGTKLATDGNGRYVDYNWSTKTVSEEGPIKNGYPDGEWHGSYPSEKVTYIDTYRDGKFVSGVSTTAAGVKYTYNRRQQPPEFKGGDAAFLAYVKKKFKYPTNLPQKGAMGVLAFTVGKDGKVSNGKFLGNISPMLSKQIADAVNSSPVWKPAIQNGMPVANSWIVQATFGVVPVAAKAVVKK
jgi:hypothetical protein